MKSACEPLEGNKVKLSVTIDESDFDRDIDAAFKKIAQEVRLPGFRQGKAPRKVLEARIGLPAAREQALRDAIPKYLGLAVKEHDVDLIATPEVDITGGADEGPIEFDATCEVRPVVAVPGYGGLRVELPSLTVADDEIDQAVDTERKRHGALVDVDRPAASGDYVVLDLDGTRDGEPVIGLSTTEWSYEIGRGWVSPIFDSELEGKGAGDTFTFSDTPNGTEDEADFSVTVHKVQELSLPAITDEWVSENLGEFDTVEEWRASITERLGNGKLGQARQVTIDRVTSALAELVEIEPPESMVASDLQARVQNTVQQFQAQGINIDQWLQVTGQDAASFVEGIRGQSEKAVKVDLALRAVATAEAIEVGDDDIDAEFERIAVQVNQKVSQVRKVYERNDAVTDLVAQITKSKALDWLLHNAEFVDEAGTAIDRDLLLGHDHDHDHDPDKDINIYINSPGGDITALFAIYDTMQFIKNDIATICLGQAASAAAVLLAAGTKGKRLALPHSRVLLHQPYGQVGYGQVTDLEIAAREILRMRELLDEILAFHTGQPIERINADTDRDFVMEAQAALEYGIIDDVIESRTAVDRTGPIR